MILGGDQVALPEPSLLGTSADPRLLEAKQVFSGNHIDCMDS